MDDFALTPAERRLFEALDHHGVRYPLLGMSAALLEGAPVATQDLDVWFESITDERIRQAARDAGGFSSLHWKRRFSRGSRTKGR